ncbi:MAG: hypothetical protein MI924_10520, partial [Chloroflexales bacterium]|nr:hypothetical protein [Chloroflexales bacterium]
AGGASPATPHGAPRPRDPRMLGQYHCEHTGSEAYARCAGADVTSCTISTGAAARPPACRKPSFCRTDPTIATEACDTGLSHPKHATCGGVKGNRHGSLAGSVRGGALQICEMPDSGAA